MKNSILSFIVSTIFIFSFIPFHNTGNVYALSNEEYIYNYLTSNLGFNCATACGVLANIELESGFNPQKEESGGGGYGLCQWTGSRRTNLINWCSSNGYDYTSIEGQLNFLKHELKNNYSSFYNLMISAANSSAGAYEVGYHWCMDFEKPEYRNKVHGQYDANGNPKVNGGYDYFNAYKKTYKCIASRIGYTESEYRGKIASEVYWVRYDKTPIKAPTYSELRINKNTFSFGEQVNFTASSDYATGYTIGIDVNGRRIVTQDLNGNTFTFTPTETGDYYAYVSAWNSAGLVDSLGVTFNVYGSSPSSPVLSLDSGKNLFAADELIEFTATSDGATGYTIGIDRGATRIITQDLNGNKYSFIPNIAGDYYSYVTAWNGIGITDSAGITFKVYDSAPKESYLSIVGGSNLFSVDSNISLVASSDCATGYTIGIDCNGERIITQDLNGNSFSFTPTRAGEYYTYVTSWNKYGICDSKGISFKVYDSAPSYSKIYVDKEKYEVNENVKFSFESDSAIWYSVGVYRNGERYDSIWDVTDNTYSYNVIAPGEYYAYVTSRNTKGWIDSEVVYFSVYSNLEGDANNDGEVTVADAVMLQKWLLSASDELTCWQNVDLYKDNKIDVFDMVMLRRLLIEKGITK